MVRNRRGYYSNTRALSKDVIVSKLEDELHKIKFYLIGVREARQRNEGWFILYKSGPYFIL